MSPSCKNIIREFLNRGFIKSPRLAEIAGFRYGARFDDLRKQGFDFEWDYSRMMYKDNKGNYTSKKSKTTIYIMLTPRDKIDKETLEIIK